MPLHGGNLIKVDLVCIGSRTRLRLNSCTVSLQIRLVGGLTSDSKESVRINFPVSPVALNEHWQIRLERLEQRWSDTTHYFLFSPPKSLQKPAMLKARMSKGPLIRRWTRRRFVVAKGVKLFISYYCLTVDTVMREDLALDFTSQALFGLTCLTTTWQKD